MAYIKIYNQKMIPIGVANTESIEVIEGAQRYAKIKNENGIINGAVNIDDELTSSEIARLVTLYDDKMMPIGMTDIEDVIGGHDYSKDYLTFTALEDANFTFTTNALQYSVDGGETWETLAAYASTPTISAGSKILWKQTGLAPTSSNGIGKFSALGNFEASGNIMSLYYGDNFIGQTDLTGKSYAFYNLFNGNTRLANAENLILPATTLTEYCYQGMFYGCTSLTTAPELSATTLTNYCYTGMFAICTSLTTAPELPATTLTEFCYYSMFNGCTSLTSSPELPATTLANNCYSSMFYGCTALTTAPELPATILAFSCYYSMFSGCTSLAIAPILPATTLADSCYLNMFEGCTSLEYLKILYTGSDSPGYMNTVSTEGDLYLYSQALASNNQFLKGFNGWRLYVNDAYSGIIDIQGGGCCCGCGGGCGCGC